MTKKLLPPNIKAQRKYSRIRRKGGSRTREAVALTLAPAQTGSGIRRRRRRRNKKQTSRGLKSVLKKSFNVIKILGKSDLGKVVIREGTKKAPDVYRSDPDRVKNKIIFKSLNSDIANTGVDLAAGSACESFKQISFANGFSLD